MNLNLFWGIVYVYEEYVVIIVSINRMINIFIKEEDWRVKRCLEYEWNLFFILYEDDINLLIFVRIL